MFRILEAGLERTAQLDKAARKVDRRNFLRLAGATIAVLGVAGCSDDDIPATTAAGA